MLIKSYVTTVVKVPGHVASESSINDFPPVDIPPVQAKHITPEVEYRLSHISCRLAYYLSNVLYHRSELGVVLLSK